MQDAGSTCAAFSPPSIESDLGLSMQHVARSRLADAVEGIRKAAAGPVWSAAAALEIAWCLLDGAAVPSDVSSRVATSGRRSAEALIHFCCRHDAATLGRVQPLVAPLLQHHVLLSEDARIALCAAFPPWCDHELSSAILNFRAFVSEESHMRVLRQAAAANSSILHHIVSHVAALQQRSPRSLFIAAFALSVSAFDESSASAARDALNCAHAAPAADQLRPSLAIAFKLKGAKRRAPHADRGCDTSPSHDEAHAQRCSYVLSLLCGLHAQISSVRSYIASSGDAFALLPLLNWLLAAEASKATDGQTRIGLAQLETIVRAILDGHGGSHPAACSLLGAIVAVAGGGCGADEERSVRMAAASGLYVRCKCFDLVANVSDLV